MSKNDPHILGKESIGKLLLQYSIPAIIGMTITSIYNIIDSIFIGHGVGAMAIAGLAVSFPLMNLVVAFCTRYRQAVPPFRPSVWGRKTWTEQRKYWETH